MSPDQRTRRLTGGRAVILGTGVLVLSSLLWSAGLRLHSTGSLSLLNFSGILAFILLFLALLKRRVWARWALVALLGAAGLAVVSRTLPVILSGPVNAGAIEATLSAAIYLICAGILAGSAAIDAFLRPPTRT